ncbi:MAG: protealysin inhibitor emfourin [Cyanobacteria bacterium J06576_12]
MEIFSACCLMLMIEISTSGGIGGLAQSASPTKSVTLNDLPNREAETLCRAFNPDVLRAISDKAVSLGRADITMYQIVVTDHHGSQRFAIDETQLSPEMLDLIDELVHRKEQQ